MNILFVKNRQGQVLIYSFKCLKMVLKFTQLSFIILQETPKIVDYLLRLIIYFE